MTTDPTHPLFVLPIDTPIGVLRLLGRGDHLVGVYMKEQTPPSARPGTSPLLARAAAQLAEYFRGDRLVFDVPLAVEHGTDFQRRVWTTLSTIPYGTTWSYGDLARTIGSPTASRAVGAANGKNPLSIIVPCHRVIGANGSLTGYAGGKSTKQWLLAHEARLARN